MNHAEIVFWNAQSGNGRFLKRKNMKKQEKKRKKKKKKKKKKEKAQVDYQNLKVITLIRVLWN